MADEKQEGEQASTLSEDELLEAKLAAFDEKVKKAGSTAMPDVPDWKYNRPTKPADKGPSAGDAQRSLGIGMTAAYLLLGGMVTGFLIGLAIDHYAHTAPLWQAGCSVGGAVLGLIYVIVLANREGR